MGGSEVEKGRGRARGKRRAAQGEKGRGGCGRSGAPRGIDRRRGGKTRAGGRVRVGRWKNVDAWGGKAGRGWWVGPRGWDPGVRGRAAEACGGAWRACGVRVCPGGWPAGARGGCVGVGWVERRERGKVV